MKKFLLVILVLLLGFGGYLLYTNKFKEIFDNNKIDTLEKAKNAPCVFNNWANFYKGEFVSNTILNANSFAKEGYSLVLDEDEMMEKHNLLERLFELRSKKSELIKNMTNSEMKNGVDAILNVIMKSINKIFF